MTSRATLATAAVLGLAALIVSALAARPAAAHEGHHHQALGTVRQIDAAKLVLTTPEGVDQAFQLSAETRYLRGSREAQREDVAVGERAVVVYETKDGADQAVEVKLADKKP